MDPLPTEGYLVHIDRAVFIPVASVAGVGVLLSIVFIAVNIHFRGYKLLKMTSPNLNLVMLSGAILFCIAVVLFGATAWLPASPSQKILDIVLQINHAGLWTASIAFSMFYAPLAAKTWRVHRIFSDAAVKGRVIKDDRLLCFVALVVVFDLGYLSVWFGIDAPECHVILTSQLPGFVSSVVTVDSLNSDDASPAGEFATATSLEYGLSCGSQYTPLWIVLLCLYKGALLYYIIYVAWATRYVTLPSMKDAGGLIISVFVTLTSFCIATPIVTSLARWPNAQYIAMSCAVFIPLFTVMLLHFIPKLLLIRRHSKDEVLTRSFSQYTTPKKPEFSDDEIRDLAIQNASLRKEVTEKQRRYKTVVEQLRVAKAKLFELSMITSESTELNTCTSDDVMRSCYTESTGDVSTSKTKGGKHKESLARELANKVTRALILKSQGIVKTDEVSMTSSSPPPQEGDEIKSAETEEVTSFKKQGSERQPNDEDDNTSQKDPDVSVCDDRKDSSKKGRHVSFDSVPMRKVPGGISECGIFPSYSKTHGVPGPLMLKPVLPILGRNSWDYYTRGTGYLRYQATVLNQGPNGTVAAITGCPVTEPRSNTSGDKTLLQHTKSGYSQAMPKLLEMPGKGVEMQSLCENPKQTKSGDFKYFSTSTSSRSPCSSTDPTPSLGRSTDDTVTSNNNVPLDFKKPRREKSEGTSSNNDTDVPSTNSAFSVVSGKGKRPFTGHNDVKVTSKTRFHRFDDIGITYEDDYSSGSDSDEYGNATTSMDSITCELFPPLTPRHKHYLRRYDAMQAKYLANREKHQRRLKKMRGKPEGSAENDVTNLPTSVPNNGDITNDTPASEKSGNSSFSQSYLYRGSKRRLLASRKIDDAYLYDSITSSDSDSESDWGNSEALQQCWERVAQMGQLPLLKPGPITFSHTRKDGIFV